MRWGKIVLLFQAIVTLVIGMIFFSQLVVIDQIEISNIMTELTSGENFTDNLSPTITDIKQRFTIAAYVLLVVSAMELLIISRLLR
ncbi:MAG: hypothetical protein ABIF18_04200 [archaeon]